MRSLLFIFTCICFNLQSQSIFTNPIIGINPNTSNPYTTGQTVNPNITVSGVGRGSGITGNGANDRYNANSWNTSSLDTSAYFYFTITPNAGYEIDFDTFKYTSQASSTGPTTFAVRSSADGYVSNIATPVSTGASISLGAATFQNKTTSITFRIYGWAASAPGGTFSINDFTFIGAVPTCNVADYCNLQHPSTASICQGSNFTSFGQVYEPGMTEAPGANANITVQWGYNTSNTNPSTWPSGNWSAATFNVQVGNNDEYQMTAGNSLTPGTYYYAYRYSINNCNYQYGGTNGIWNGSTNVNGVLTVNAPSPTSINVTENSGTPNDGIICFNTSATLTANVGIAYSWSNGANTNNITVNPNPGTHFYTVTVTDNNNCTSTAMRMITVNSIPNANITVVENSGTPNDGTICVGQSATLNASGGGTYLWSTGSTTASISPTPVTTTQYTVTVTNASGCTSTAQRTITVNDPIAAIMPTSIIICANQTANLLASGGSNYVWSNGPTTAENNGLSFGTYTVTISDGNGCSDTESATISQNDTNNNGTSGIFESYAVLNTTGNDVYYDLHNNTGNPDFNGNNLGSFLQGSSALIKGGQIKTYKNNPANICGGRIYYSIYPSVASPGPFSVIGLPFQMNLGGNDQQWGTLAGNINFLNALTPGNYKIAMYVDANGDGINPSDCGCDPLHVQNNSGLFFIADFIVTGCSPVEAGNIIGDNVLCSGETTTLTSDGDVGGIWSSSNTITATINAMSGEVSTIAPGTSNIKYLVNGDMGCPSDSTEIILTVNANPTPTITGPTSACSGGNITLNTGMYTAYDWSHMGGSNVSATFNNITSNTSYSITVTDSNMCTGTDEHSVSVNLNPTTVVAFNNNPICSGHDAKFTLTGTANGELLYNFNGGMNQTSVFDNNGDLLLTFPNATSSVTLNLISITDLTTMCSSALMVSSVVSVNANSSDAINHTACNSYTWPINNITYYVGGIYMDTISNAIGCDSFITLNLTIHHSNNATPEFVTTCTSYTWPVNNVNYNIGGTYYHITTNNFTGCLDSSTLVLTVSSSAIENQNDPNCYSNVADALANAMSGDTVEINSGNYNESFIVPNGVVLIINTGASVTNNGMICNLGTIILNGGSFLNSGIYTGEGNFEGNFVNGSVGSLKPGNCSN